MNERRMQLIACQTLQAATRRMLKNLIYSNIFPWCPASPVRERERLQRPPLQLGDGLYTPESTVDYETKQPSFRLFVAEGPTLCRHFVGRTTKLCRQCGQKADAGISFPHSYPGLVRHRSLHQPDDEFEEFDEGGAAGPLWPRAAAARVQRAFRCLKSRRAAGALRAARLRARRLRSVAALAGAWRAHRARAAYFARRAMRVYLAFLRARAARLQAVWRAHLVRTHARFARQQARRRAAAPPLQAAARRSAARLRFLQWRAVRDALPARGVRYDGRQLLDSPWELQLPDPTRRRLLALPLPVYAVWPLPRRLPISGV